MKVEIIIENKGVLCYPLVEEGIQWSTERKGVPGQLTFTVIKDDTLDFTEGNPVQLLVDGKGVFFGFVFTKKRSKECTIVVTAYDQLRYLKNKDTCQFNNLTAGEAVKQIANDFQLQTGELEDTGFKIPSRIEENSTLFDMIQTFLDLTIDSTREMYVLYDDFGKLTLRNIGNRKVDILIDQDTGEDFDYTSSIDANTYNKVKLSYANEEAGTKDIYVVQDGNNMNSWGVLQFFETLQKGENGVAKAEALLSLYNTKTRNLSVSKAVGDIRVRGGCMVPVVLNLGDVLLEKYMLVEKCTHTFDHNQHLMDLTLRGGEFLA